jgi:ankyrin repeat protein
MILSVLVSVAGLLSSPVLAAEAELPAEVGAPIARAAMERDMATVRSLLAEGVDPNEPGADGTPALH